MSSSDGRRDLPERDAGVLHACAADDWRSCEPADLARLTAAGFLSCGHLLTDAGRRALGLPGLEGGIPNGGWVPQYAK